MGNEKLEARFGGYDKYIPSYRGSFVGMRDRIRRLESRYGSSYPECGFEGDQENAKFIVSYAGADDKRPRAVAPEDWLYRLIVEAQGEGVLG